MYNYIRYREIQHRQVIDFQKEESHSGMNCSSREARSFSSPPLLLPTFLAPAAEVRLKIMQVDRCDGGLVRDRLLASSYE